MIALKIIGRHPFPNGQGKNIGLFISVPLDKSGKYGFELLHEYGVKFIVRKRFHYLGSPLLCFSLSLPMSVGAVMSAAPPSARKGGKGQKLEEQAEHQQGGREFSVTHETPPAVSY